MSATRALLVFSWHPMQGQYVEGAYAEVAARLDTAKRVGGLAEYTLVPEGAPLMVNPDHVKAVMAVEASR